MSVIFIFTISILLQNHICISSANDTLIQGERLLKNRTLVSKSNIFEFGFFTKDTIHYFIGIWVKNSSVEDGVVWVANRENPVTNISFSEVSFYLDGDLVLTQSQSIIWSSNTGREPISGIAMLLDSGNLVLRNTTNSNSEIMWQSFDHPTDTWLPGAILGYDSLAGKNISLSSGSYSLKYEYLIDEDYNYVFIINIVPSDLVYIVKNPSLGFDPGFDGWIDSSASAALSFQHLGETPAFIKLNDSGFVNLMEWKNNLRSFKIRNLWGASDICYYFLSRGSLYYEHSFPKSLVPPAFNNNILLTKWYHQCRPTIFHGIDSEHKKVIIVGGVLFFVLLILLFLWIFREKVPCFQVVDIDYYYLSAYTYIEITIATKLFSTKLGEGGFGSVFKGRSFDHTEVAVKKLRIVGQGEKQFRTEVQTLGMIRHTNLVRLLGFCADGSRRVLVYEYMPKGSLDSHLFKESSNILSWKDRYKIAVGTARGLAYLHEHCKDCIIHCDIKPENVLIDENFLSKIADFGMAKLLGRDFSRALTTIRGTIGYLAPEWYSGKAITEKADVYSFGMMLFEIISGKRNASKFNNRRYPYFPLYASVKMNEGEVMCLLDEKLGGNVNVVELIQTCKAAGWCIQESEECRPSMGKVILMLQGVIDVGIPPVPRHLLNLVDAEEY